MGQTITEKVLSRIVGRDVKPGEIIWAEPDMIILHDLNAPRYLREVEEIGAGVRFPDRVIIVMDHKVPCADDLAKEALDFGLAAAKRLGITRIYHYGDHGISHQLPADKGLVRPGMLVLTSDTHANTLGALGSLTIPVSYSIHMVLALGKTWLKVPETIQVELTGSVPEWTMSRDVAQWVIARIGQEAADYRAIEFSGSAVIACGIDQRLTLCNVTVEVGAKAAHCAADVATAAYLGERGSGVMEPFGPDPDAEYAFRFTFDMAKMEPMVAIPPSPECVVPASQVAGTTISQVYIGSCAGGRLEDLRMAARIFKGRRVAEGLRCFVVPTSMDIYREALAEGLLGPIVEAGAVVLAPSCGPCYGYQARLSKGDVCLATSTRNEPGRMGSKEATIFLASAATCAASAITGQITDPRLVTV